MKTIRFNTNRSYSAQGQRIAAARLDDGRVAFVDIDRGLDYATAWECELTRDAVMRAYDCNHTTSFPRDQIDLRDQLIATAKLVGVKI